MDLTLLFCNVDDFVNQQNVINVLSVSEGKVHRPRDCRLSNSEIMTICIAYHQSGYKNFKAFYLEHVCKYLKTQFPDLVSYNRLKELMPKVSYLLANYLISKLDQPTGISYIDSTSIQVCKPKRMSRNKVFKEIAKKSKSSIGWFFGFSVPQIQEVCM